MALASAIGDQPVRVITNSLDVAQLLSERASVELIVTGGEWSPTEHHLSGTAALATVARYRADLAFIGTCAIHPKLGLTANTQLDAELKASMLAHAAQGILLADASKFGHIAPHFVTELAAFSHLITDQPADWLTEVASKLTVLTVPTDETSSNQ